MTVLKPPPKPNIIKISLDSFKEPGREGHKLGKDRLLEVCSMYNDSGFEFVGGEGYLSPSSINTWIKCPRYFYHDKLDPDSKKKSLNFKMHYGSTGHKALEVLYKKLMKQDPIIEEEMVAYAADTYTKVFEEIKSEFDENEKLTPEEFTEERDKQKDALVTCVGNYIKNKEYELVGSVINVEQDFMFTMEGIPFYGIVDLETESKIIDFKFAQQSSGIQSRGAAMPGDFQLWTYEKNFDKPGVLNIVIPPPKTARSDRKLVTEIRRSDYLTWSDEDFVEVIHGMLTDINAGRFEKRGLVIGGCAGCKYYKHCNKASTV